MSDEDSKIWKEELLGRVRRKARRKGVEAYKLAQAEKLQAKRDGRREHAIKVLVAAAVGAFVAAVLQSWGWIVKTAKVVFLE